MILADRLDAYARLVRLDRPIGILLLLWPTLWALWLSSDGRPDWAVVTIFVAGTVLMRSAGCAINDFADRHIDPFVERTRHRPLATGRVTPAEALAVAAALAFAAFLLVLQLNRLTVLLSVPAALLAATYPFTKRFFPFPQAYLGVAFGFGIPMAYAAHTESVPLVAWVLLAANVCWSIAYDTEYAMVDRPDDLKLGIKTSAITLGRYDVAGVMAAHGAFLAIMAGVGSTLELGWTYNLGLATAAGLAAYQYFLIRDRDRQRCFQAFLHNNWVGAAIFVGIVASSL
ncbi:4-hydroxybenzoate octaprenyltransferase [Pelomicrobium sp.]|jgi:4-hydroxybenzoate polyprenyltransferase|uniref:4-hydroxybenzoate octaprenyltransferase n=1 Tax=Pelomicrobium sp. TaxID=2815319 RepID=UPI002FDECFC7